MKLLNGYKMRVVLIGFVAGMVLGGRKAKADFTWTRKSDMPTWRYNCYTSVVGGKIYAIGGDSAIKRVDEYDPSTDTWARKADWPNPRPDASTCVVNGKIYVIGGGVWNGSMSTVVEVYDPATDTWAEQTELPSPRYTPPTNVVDGIIYVIGSKGGTNYSEWLQFPANIVEAYNPAADTWTRKADMPTPRWNESSCAVNGKIYIIGGSTSGGITAAVEEYDPMTDTWTVKAPMPTARCLLGTCVVDGKICAIGGWRENVNFSTVEVYDPQTDTWMKGVDIPVPTEGMSTSVVNERIYVMGGWSTPTGNGEDGANTSAVYVSDVIIDFNGDGIVDSADMCIMVDNWHTNSTLCDIAPLPFGDGFVDVQDLIILSEHLFEEVNDPTLIAHWALDEAEGMVVADSAGDNDAFVVGGTAWQPDSGQVDGALQLNGVDGCAIADFVLNPAGGPFSVFAWINGGAPGQVVVSQQATADWLATDAEGNLMTELKCTGRSAGPLYCETVITDGQWHRIGLVWDGSYRKLYVDGVVVADDTPLGLEGSQMGLYIGTGKAMEPGTYFSGLIDDVRIYDRAVHP
jgi:N-acetylneuraminic acid mutarotase